jgi:hypothetical protein
MRFVSGTWFTGQEVAKAVGSRKAALPATATVQSESA